MSELPGSYSSSIVGRGTRFLVFIMVAAATGLAAWRLLSDWARFSQGP